jgi:hypothetical protein
MSRGRRVGRFLPLVLAGCAALAVLLAGTAGRLAAQEDAPVIRVGQTVRGTLSDDDVDLFDDAPTSHWRISGRRGERLRIRMASPDFEPFVSLERHDAAGHVTVVAYRSGPAGDTGATLDATLPADGEYVIEATVLDADQRGSYVLFVEELGG